MFLEVKEGGQDRDEEAVKVYLIKFIADLPLKLVYGLRDCLYTSQTFPGTSRLKKIAFSYFMFYTK